MLFITDKKFIRFVAIFLSVYVICYYGTIVIIGLAAPGGMYNLFVSKHLDYVSWIKESIIFAVGAVLAIFGVETNTEPGFVIRVCDQKGVFIAMSCVGYGVYSFWIAFVVAHTGIFLKKFFWILGGILILWFINVVRISIFLFVINKNKEMPFGVDHHTWFNIMAYGFIFGMIYLFNKKQNAIR